MSYRVEKEWKAYDLDCVVLMGHLGHRCGYVGVPEGHRLYGVGYDEARRIDGDWIDVHGGLTYAGPGSSEHNGKAYLYPSENPNALWWFGYDCAHLGDAPDPSIAPAPAFQHLSFGEKEVVRSLEYCIGECEQLAEQLADRRTP